MDQVFIESERETDSGWNFTCRFRTSSGSERSIDLGLSWPDYDLWAPDGSVPPERVAAAVLTLLLEHEEELVRERLDAAQVRRIIPGSDEALQQRVKRTRL